MASSWGNSWIGIPWPRQQRSFWGDSWGVVDVIGTDEIASNYEVCQRSGFKLYPEDIIRDGHSKMWVRKRSHDSRHPQEMVRHTQRSTKGSPSPESPDIFLTDNEINSDSF